MKAQIFTSAKFGFLITILIQCIFYFPVNGDRWDEIASARQTLFQLCPDFPQGGIIVYHRYDNSTKKCHDATGGGPCGKNMLFYEAGWIYGYCDCNYEENDRTLVFHPDSNQCYFVYQQAYCKAGEWLTLDSNNGVAKCTTNPCSQSLNEAGGSGRGKRESSSNETDEMILFNNRCIKLGSHQPECKENEVVKFQESSIDPICVKNLLRGTQYGAGVISQPNKCRTGSSSSITGKCQTSLKFD